jgi:hypothetical protein
MIAEFTWQKLCDLTDQKSGRDDFFLFLKNKKAFLQ